MYMYTVNQSKETMQLHVHVLYMYMYMYVHVQTSKAKAKGLINEIESSQPYYNRYNVQYTCMLILNSTYMRYALCKLHVHV